MRKWQMILRLFLATLCGWPAAKGQKFARPILLLSSTHYAVAREMSMDLDSSLIIAAHMLGLSRLAVITDGFPGPARTPADQWVDTRTPGDAIKLLAAEKGAAHLRLLVLLGAYYAFQPNAFDKYKDSVSFFLSRAAKESNDPVWNRQIHCLLGKTWTDGREPVGDNYFQQCIDECRKAGDTYNEAKAWFYRALYTPYSPESSKQRIGWFQKAADLYDSLHMPADEANCLVDLGYMYVTTAEQQKSEASFRQALQLQEATGFLYTDYTTDDLAMVGSFEGKYGEPLMFSVQTVRTAESLKDSLEFGIFYNRLGMLEEYQDSKDSQSVDALLKAIHYFVKTENDPDIYRSLGSIINSNYYLGHPAEALALVQQFASAHPPQAPMNRFNYNLLLVDCYMRLEKFGPAEKAMDQAMKLETQLEALRGNYSRPHVFGRKGELLYQEGHYAEARYWLQRALDDPSGNFGNVKSRIVLLRSLFSADSGLGKFPEAFIYLKSFASLLDSSLNVQLNRQAEELAVQYETAKKEADIKLRDQRIQNLQQAGQLRQTRLQQAELIRNITIGCILIALAIIGLLYRLYVEKKKHARVITQKNELLENLLTQKEWLLKEVHHRVKNNLHTIFCLLESQAKYLRDDALEAIADSQHRIYAMSLLHQKVYQTEDIKMVDMAVYLREFIRYLRESFGTPAHINLYSDIQPLQFGINQAIPIALIVNETVTNSIKHAFPEGREGEIHIRLKQEGAHIHLTIADNGVGMHPEIINENERSFGLSLIQGLATELGGNLDFENHIGTTVHLIFTTT